MTLEELYQENYPIVYGYLLSLCGSKAQAEDLASETFLRAIQKPGKYDGCCKPSTWLCTIARNLFLNEQKRQRRHVELDQAGQVCVPDCSERLLDHVLAQEIVRAAERMPEEMRQVFCMRTNGMRFREIGDALGKTETWARVTFFRIKTRLWEELED